MTNENYYCYFNGIGIAVAIIKGITILLCLYEGLMTKGNQEWNKILID